MATVLNRNGLDNLIENFTPPDKKYKTPNRSNAGSPVAALVPQYASEIVLDTTNRVLWRAVGTTNADWIPIAEMTT